LSHTSFLRDILQAHIRSNPGYELLLFERLPEACREQISEIQNDPENYGVLWPQVDGLVPKVVDQETALLFLTMQQPGPIPLYVRHRFRERCNQAIAELVLDGILEIDLAQDEHWVSGGTAFGLLHPASPPTSPKGKIARLSREALEYAEALKIDSSVELSSRLYTYNSIPLSPLWQKRIPNAGRVADFLGFSRQGRHRKVFDRWFALSAGGDQNSGWWSWQHLEKRNNPSQRWQPEYKLYISPLPEAWPEVIGSIVNELGSAGVTSFKIGSGLHGLLRPDKMVAYLADFAELANLSAGLEKALAGCPAQGVPFSAGIDSSGLLSWGMDPPHQSSPNESWRVWVTNHLAVSITTCQAQETHVRPFEFALERLRLEGIDTDTWTPQQAIWQKPG
jgi:hypothetical protein